MQSQRALNRDATKVQVRLTALHFRIASPRKYLLRQNVIFMIAHLETLSNFTKTRQKNDSEGKQEKTITDFVLRPPKNKYQCLEKKPLLKKSEYWYFSNFSTEKTIHMKHLMKYDTIV